MKLSNPDSDVLDNEAGTGKAISTIRREAALLDAKAKQTALFNDANCSRAAEPMICLHCHQPHEEYYLCDELMLAHGLPCKFAGPNAGARPARRD